MKKLVALLASILVVFTLAFFTGCSKDEGGGTGTLNLDNYVNMGMYVKLGWTSGTYSVGALGYRSYIVDAGSGSADCYTNGGSYWAGTSTTVLVGGSTTLYIYEYKSTDELRNEVRVTPYKPEGLTK